MCYLNGQITIECDARCNKSMKKQTSTSIPSFDTLNEEIANVVTHGIGAGLSMAGLAVLVMLAIWAGDVYRIVSMSIYGASLVLLYLASTFYHSVQRPEIRQSIRDAFQTFDHVAIFILIAGTYTPLVLVKLRGHGGWTILIVVWTLAVVGSIVKAFFRNRYTRLSVGAYMAMGWLSLFLFKGMASEMGVGAIVWILVGGAFYSLGVIPFLWRKLPYNHAIWHLFVMAGSLCHYFAVLFYVLPEG